MALEQVLSELSELDAQVDHCTTELELNQLGAAIRAVEERLAPNLEAAQENVKVKVAAKPRLGWLTIRPSRRDSSHALVVTLNYLQK